jgi:murein DD-endopeptidase MepM/ murein hydrolase activator NlpD
MNLVYPLEKKGVKTSGFGPRKHPVKKTTKHHNGIDIGVPDGTDVYSVLDGEVVRSDMRDKKGYGNFIIVKHNVDGETLFSCYAHLTKRLVDVGDKVSKGEKIAESGGGQGLDKGAGISTGPHLHFEIRKSINGDWVNPEPYINGAPIQKGFGDSKDTSDENLTKILKDIVKGTSSGWDKVVNFLKSLNITEETKKPEPQNEKLKKMIKKIL